MSKIIRYELQIDTKKAEQQVEDAVERGTRKGASSAASIPSQREPLSSPPKEINPDEFFLGVHKGIRSDDFFGKEAEDNDSSSDKNSSAAITVVPRNQLNAIAKGAVEVMRLAIPAMGTLIPALTKLVLSPLSAPTDILEKAGSLGGDGGIIPPRKSDKGDGEKNNDKSEGIPNQTKKGIGKSLQSIVASIGGVASKVAIAGAATAAAISAFVLAGQALENYSSDLFATMTAVKYEFEGIMYTMGKELGPVLSSLIKQFMEIVKAILPILIDLLKLLLWALQPVIWITKKLAQVLNVLWEGLKLLLDTALVPLLFVLHKIVDVFSTLYNAIRTLILGIVAALDKINPFKSEQDREKSWKAAESAYGDLTKALTSLLTEIPQDVKDAWQNAGKQWEALKKSVESLTNEMQEMNFILSGQQLSTALFGATEAWAYNKDPNRGHGAIAPAIEVPGAGKPWEDDSVPPGHPDKYSGSPGLPTLQELREIAKELKEKKKKGHSLFPDAVPDVRGMIPGPDGLPVPADPKKKTKKEPDNPAAEWEKDSSTSSIPNFKGIGGLASSHAESVLRTFMHTIVKQQGVLPLPQPAAMTLKVTDAVNVSAADEDRLFMELAKLRDDVMNKVRNLQDDRSLRLLYARTAMKSGVI